MNSEIISAHLADHLAVVERLRAQQSFIEDLAKRIIGCLDAGGKVLIFGNGGSAADAQHIAAEFVVRFRRNRRALPAIALTTDTSILTAGANDFGFDTVFARQVEALASLDDIVIGISTSGNSANVLHGLRAAKEKRCVTVAFTGEKDSECLRVADITFRPPSSVTARVQECHMLAAHIICELVEEHLLHGS